MLGLRATPLFLSINGSTLKDQAGDINSNNPYMHIIDNSVLYLYANKIGIP